MKDIKVVVEKMTRNRRKMIAKTADSLVCPFHSIQFSPLGFLPLWQAHENKNPTSEIILTHCVMSAHRSNDMERATSYLHNGSKFFLEENSCFYAFSYFTRFFLLL